jgi:predicted aldo/keto reductase-like oxidoreductase
VKLATKLPTWLVQSLDDFDRFLNEQLTRLQTDHIDFYLLHGLNIQRWTKLREMNIFKPAEKAIADGRISYLGFSFHDDLEIFKKIIDCYDKWTFCQIQYNYMDTHYQAGTEGLRYADDKGIAVVVMEPIRGGQLAKQPPETVSQLWAKASIQRSPAEWALQWVWNQPEIALALSGMSTMQHVEENLASADRSGVGSLTDEELTLIKNVTEAYRELSPIPCTECGYCMPCPNGVNIPGVFALHNAAMIYKDVSKAQMLYQMQIPEENRADKCIACGDCLELCPQEIPIPEWLEKSNKLLRTQ